MKAESLTTHTKQSGVSLNASTILCAIKKTDLAEEVEYVSTSGSGEIKTYIRLTDKGLRYGINREGVHEIRTEARFYPETFPALLRQIVKTLDEEVTQLGG